MKWYAALGIVLLIALTFRIPLLAYAIYTMIGIAIVSRAMTRYSTEHLVARRIVSDTEAHIGDQVTVAVTYRNTGRLPLIWLLLEDVLPYEALAMRPRRLTARRPRIHLTMMRAQQEKTFLYQVTCHRRGFYQIGPLVAETGDLFGLHRRFRVLAEPVFLTVEPDAVPLDQYSIESRQPLGEIRMTHRLYDDPSRLAGCRTYEPGDPLHRIHWPATARTGTLQTKLFEPSCVAGATVLLDLHQAAYHGGDAIARSDLAITAAASIAEHLFRNGQQVGLVSNGRDGAERIRTEGWQTDARTRQAIDLQSAQRPPSDQMRPLRVDTGRNPDQLHRIIRLLARAELNQGLRLSDLVRETAHDLPRNATIVAIVRKVSDDELVALESIRRRGYVVIAMVNQYDPIDFYDASIALSALRIEARHLADVDSLATMCQQITLLGIV